jgi:hypothetical protein
MSGMNEFSTWAPWISCLLFGVSTALWMWSAFSPVRGTVDHLVDDLQKAAKRNAGASLFAATALLVQAIDLSSHL